MSLSRSGAERRRLLPGSVNSGLRRMLHHAAGGGLILLALAGWAALATWSIRDPSYNNATSDAPANLLGLWGATIADLSIQSLGLAAIALFLPLALWGWHIVTGIIPKRVRVRLAMWPVAPFLLAGGLSALPSPKTWPLPSGLGGLLGDLSMTVFTALSALLPSFVTSFLAATAMLAGGAVCLLFACGLSPRDLSVIWSATGARDGVEGEPRADRAQDDENSDDEDDVAGGDADRLSERLGAVVHWTMSAPALFARIIGRRRPPDLDRIAEEDDADGDIEDGSEAYMKRAPREAVDEAGRIEPFFDAAAQNQGASSDADQYQITQRSDQTAARRTVKRLPGVASTYTLPPVRLLKKPPTGRRRAGLTNTVLQQNARLLEEVLQDFGVKGEIVNVRPGPVVTLYELEPAPGTKSSRVISLADDIARSMSAAAARVAVVAGRNAIGIELPNEQREIVYLRELFESEHFLETQAGLALAMGKDIGGDAVVADLSRMPHLLIAGTTGSGKSVGVNTMILSLLYRYAPDQCKFIMIDPKMLELSVYDGIPHLLAPVVTDPKKAVVALKWTVKEMEERYKCMSKLGVRNIDGYNERVKEAQEKDEIITRTVQTGFDRETGQAIYEEEEMDYQPMPYIVVIVDEMADLMMVAGKDIEGAVQRLAQMARAAGIHLIAATQRPSVDVITGTIKANFPTRVSFQVTSKIDSRTILGEQGGEQLLGLGDMLYMAGGGRITRVHGPFVSVEEVEKIVRYLKRQGVPEYLEAITEEEDVEENGPGDTAGGSGDSLYDQAVAIVLRDGKASTSYVQRRLSIGYNRAATLIERMEEEGVIGPANHAGKREILVGDGTGEQPY